MRDDALLFLQIINSMDTEVVDLVHHCEFVKDLMDYLEYLYSGKGYASRIYEVCKAFYLPEKEAKTLTTYFMEFKKIYKEQNLIFPFSTDIKVQQAQREQMAIMSFLAGLPSEFETAKSHILSDHEITSLQDVFSWVLRIVLHPISKPMHLLQKEKIKMMLEETACFRQCRETNVQAATTSTVEWVEVGAANANWVVRVSTRCLHYIDSASKLKEGTQAIQIQFTVKEVEKWWKENQLSAYKKYGSSFLA